MNSVVNPAGILLVSSLLSVSVSAATIPLVNHGDTWRWHKGNTPLQTNWKTVSDASLDATWLTGAGGFGYSADTLNETNQCGTILTDMRNAYTTLYMRKQFTIAAAVDSSLHLQLTMDFDDGFIAWLDGAYLTNALVTGAPNEPATNATASTTHESSRGTGSPNDPVTYDFGLVGSRLGVGTHTFAMIGLNQATTSSDLIQIADLFAAPPPVPVTNVWSVGNSPIVIPTNVTVGPGSTLIIEAGVTVQFASGIDLTVANGGLLLAEGTSNAPIRFTRSGASGSWGHVTINGSVGSPESRITYAHFELNGGSPTIEVAGGTAFLDHLTFGNTAISYIHLDSASFVISHCYFPTATAGFELVHGTGGIKSGGHGIFYRNYFGTAVGYNDVVDFTGGNRPGPIVQFFENVFNGATDDCLDLDSTDAWVEGNIFLHVHRDGAPDSSSGVSGGSDNASNSEITIIRNIFYDCDHAAMGKQTNFYTLLNNTIVHQSHVGGEDPIGAVVNLSDPGFSEGRGMYLEGNIVFDAESLTQSVTSAIVTYTNNLLPLPWTGLGGNNLIADPLLKHVPQLSETIFTNWEEAQIMWDWLSLLPGSPAIGAGPNGNDLGAVIPMGASISGEPDGITTNASAVLRVGINRTGNGLPVGGWPNGSGYVAYKWRFDGGAWSGETSINTPIVLHNLSDGPHQVEVTGKRDTGLYQDDPLLGDEVIISRSKTWTVQSSPPLLIENPVRVGNTLAFTFSAQAGRTYSVLYRDALDAAHPWARLADIPAQASTGPYTFVDTTATSSERFYEVVTPAQP
jgi:hypothetical protein